MNIELTASDLEIRAVDLPFVPIALLRAVSLTTLELTIEFVRAPGAKAEEPMRKVAAYRACGLLVPRNMAYPTIMSGVVRMMKICRRSIL